MNVNVKTLARTFGDLSPSKEETEPHCKQQKMDIENKEPTWLPDNATMEEKVDLILKQLLLLNTIQTTVSSFQSKLEGLQQSLEFSQNEAVQFKCELQSTKKQVANLQSELERERASKALLARDIKSMHEKQLQLECQSRRSNLNVDNVPENEGEKPEDTMKIFREFMRTKLKLGNASSMQIERCHRVGQKRHGGKPRTIIAKFSFYQDRQEVWSRRSNLKDTNIWLREDFPVEYEERRRKMYPIVSCAKKIPAFRDIYIHIDKLVLNKKTYTVDQLEMLPDGIKASQVATRTANDVTYFFHKESPLSNFHPAAFTIEDVSYAHTEQYLQSKKALKFKDKHTADLIMATDNPLQCYILGQKVKQFDSRVWYDDGSATLAMEEGCYAKFEQNPKLKQALLGTGDTTIAEASKNAFWATGLPINHKDAAKPPKWTGSNNLGKVLMKVRQRFQNQQTQSTLV